MVAFCFGRSPASVKGGRDDLLQPVPMLAPSKKTADICTIRKDTSHRPIGEDIGMMKIPCRENLVRLESSGVRASARILHRTFAAFFAVIFPTGQPARAPCSQL